MDRHSDLEKAVKCTDEAEKIANEIKPNHKCTGEGCIYCIRNQKCHTWYDMAARAFKRLIKKTGNFSFHSKMLECEKRSKIHSNNVVDSCFSQVDDDDY